MRRHRTIYPVICSLLILLLATATGLAAGVETIVGSIRNVQGSGSILRGSQAIDLRPGVTLRQGDWIRTGTDSSVGIILRDDTLLSLGPESEISIDEFAFEPSEGRHSLLVRVLKGVLSYISGQIAKLSSDSVKIETPVATIGVRGTRLAIRVNQNQP